MSDTTIPKGSLVLVTGANGYIASHIVDALLAQGYQVRGTARSVSKLDVLKEIWAKKYPKAHFEVVVIEDMAKDGAFDDAVKGVSGVIHPASVISWSPVPEEVIDPTVKGTLALLRSAATQPTITRFVLTSSAAAGTFPRPNEVYSVGENSWNEVSLQEAYQEGPLQDLHVYSASKVLGEQAAWKFVQEKEPGFVLNTVIPHYTAGPMLDPKGQSGSSAGMFKAAFEKEDFGFIVEMPSWFVDVRDTATLHVLGLTSSKLASPGYRIWASAEPFIANDWLKIFRKMYPERKWRDDFENPARNMIQIDNKRGTELLGKWRGMEESIKDTLGSLGL